MIPKVYHHIWIDPRGLPQLTGMPEDVLSNVRAWQASEPGYTEVFWLLPQVLDLCAKAYRPETAVAIEACRFPAVKADLGRLLILLLHGGFWIDLKLRPLRSFLSSLAGFDLVTTEHFVKDDLPEPNGTLSNSFIGAAPGHPAVALALALATCNVLRRMGGSIYGVTGAPNIMLALEQIPLTQRGNYRMLGHREAWGSLFEIHGGSYNNGDMHWSTRQQRGEDPYVEIAQ